MVVHGLEEGVQGGAAGAREDDGVDQVRRLRRSQGKAREGKGKRDQCRRRRRRRVSGVCGWWWWVGEHVISVVVAVAVARFSIIPTPTTQQAHISLAPSLPFPPSSSHLEVLLVAALRRGDGLHDEDAARLEQPPHRVEILAQVLMCVSSSSFVSLESGEWLCWFEWVGLVVQTRIGFVWHAQLSLRPISSPFYLTLIH